MNGDFIVLSKFFNLTCSAYLGIAILCLPLILKQSLISCFNISSEIKACKQRRQKYYLPRYNVRSYMNILKSCIRT